MGNIENRISSVDQLRGIASLSVCWFHLTNTYPIESLIRNSGWYGWLGVEMFFVISGFVIPYAMYEARYQVGEDWFQFMKKRVIRIEPPYLVMVAVIPVLWYLSSLAPGYQGDPVEIDTTQVLLHVGYLNGFFDVPWLNPVFWTLAIEFQFYLLVSLSLGLMSHTNGVIRVTTLVVMIGSSLLLTSDVLVFKYLPLFAMGIVVFQLRTGLVQSLEGVILLSLSAGVLTFTLGWMITTVGLFTALVILLYSGARVRGLVFLGAISYSLYLVHIPIGGRVVNLVSRFTDSELGMLFTSLLATVVSIIAAYLLYRLVERPSINWSKRVHYRSRAGSQKKRDPYGPRPKSSG